MAEGAPLLRAYRLTPIEGSNPSLSAIYKKTSHCGVFLYMAERAKAALTAQTQREARRPEGARISAKLKFESIPLSGAHSAPFQTQQQLLSNN